MQRIAPVLLEQQSIVGNVGMKVGTGMFELQVDPDQREDLLKGCGTMRK